MSVFKSLSVFLLAILTVLFLGIESALAHTPHDQIFEVDISPTYDQDQTLFIHSPTEGGLLKSEDGGKSWKIIVKGLNNKYGLSSLDISSQFPKTLFLSSLGDGIYKSQDKGTSWSQVNQGLETLNINLVSISPDSSDVVLAAGTKQGLYKTKNGGKSWYPIIDGDSKITAIAFFPKQHDSIVIGDRQGILYKSNDEGESWNQVFTLPQSEPIRTIVISPNFPSDKTFFVGTEKGGIFKTVDGGISFQEVNEGLSDRAILSLAISPNYGTDSTVFASTWQGGVFHSNDRGNTWRKYSRGLTKISQADEFKEPHFRDVKISPTFSEDKTIFLAAFTGLFKSTNGGRVWGEIDIANTIAETITGIGLSPDYINDSTVAITTYYKGIYISNDQGLTWTDINKFFAKEDQVKHNRINFITGRMVFSPNYRSDKTILSGFWGYFLKSTDGGKYWHKISLIKQYERLNKPKGARLSEFELTVSPNFVSDRTIYLGMHAGGIFRSTDGGESFSVVGTLAPVGIGGKISLNSLVISPDFSSDKTLYAGGPIGVYKTVDGGFTWQPASNGIPWMNANRIALAISPSYQVDKTVFAGTKIGLFETKDGGKSWLKLAQTVDGGDAYIQEIGISPNYQSDRTFIIAAQGKGLFKTVNGGKTFTRISDDLTGPIKFSPSYSLDRTIYASSGTELSKSTDGGNSWQTITIPFSNYNFLTILYLRLTLSTKLRFIAAVIAALVSYLLLGYLGLEKKLPFRKSQIRSGGAFTVFIVVLILFSGVL
ncbi:MAG: hypothetical protein QNJ34_08050 [Xenococcaceae cyanobacterium MO_188.B29]|nr:hypothetical protein [Xenococcaceae cyanobacterium MO_188.B29]